MAWLLNLVYQAWSTPGFVFDDKEYPDRMARAFGLSQYYWVDPTKIPVSGHQTTTKRVPEVFPLPFCNAVSQRFKDLVEEFEPGVHQFMPLKLRFKNGESLPQMYYVFNCAVAFDAVLIEPSDIEWKFYEEIDHPYVTLPAFKPVTLSAPRIGSHHLWIGLYLRPNGYGVFCSDAFQKQLKKRKIRFLEQVHCPELDIPWSAEDNIQPALDWEARHGEPLGAILQLRAEILKLHGKPEL